MNLVSARNALLCHAVVLLLACPSLWAQDQAQGGDNIGLGELYTSSLPLAVPDPLKVVPVRVLRELELGAELERFASVSNRLLERREKELTDAIWKPDANTTITVTAIMVRDANRPGDRRLGARFDGVTKIDPAKGKETRSVHIVDLDELKHMETGLITIRRALDQSSLPRGELSSVQYRSRSGFTVSLTLTQKPEGLLVNAAVDQVTVDSKDKARRTFDEYALLLRTLIQNLSAM